MQIPPHLVQQVRDGRIVLLLGAGASLGAKTPDGSGTAPNGQQLRDLLSDRFLGGAFKDASLATVAEYSISESNIHEVQQYIYEELIDLEPAPFHHLVPTFKWHGIATLNYDLILEKVYQKSPLQQLRPAYSNDTRFEEIQQTSKDLLYLKLHGCITKASDAATPLILTHDQYVLHRRNRSRLFDAFLDWAREHSVVFVGSKMEDSDLRGLLLEVTESIEQQPRYFLVTPNADEILRRFWSQKKVDVLDGTFADFLRAIDDLIPGMARAVPLPAADIPIAERFSDPTARLSESCQQTLDHDLEYVHSGTKTEAISPIDFYRGFDLAWSGVVQHLDARRDITDDILLKVLLSTDVARGPALHCLTGPAGCGKTVLLRRLAWEAATELDRTVFYANNLAGLTKDALTEIAGLVADRLFVFVDNAADASSDIVSLFDAADARSLDVTFIVAERTNEWNTGCAELEAIASSAFVVDDLSAREITGILDKLEQYGAEGTLRGLSREEQEQRFHRAAARQLLVALHETTLGKPFEEIIKDEYDSILPSDAQDLYLTICTLNRTGVPVRAGLIARTHGIPFERFRERFLAPLEHVVFSFNEPRTGDLQYRARHPHVAELVFRQVSPTPQDRFTRIRHILACLNVSYYTDRIAFQDLTNARRLMEVISDEGLAEQIYLEAEEHVRDDGHLYLQHANFELRRTNRSPSRLRELLAKAQSLLPHHRLVRHLLAEAEFSLAQDSDNPLVREKHYQEGMRIVRPLMGRDGRDSYGYHTAFKIQLARLKEVLKNGTSPDTEIADAVRNCESVLAEGLQRFAADAALLSAEAELARILEDEDRVFSALEAATAQSLKHPYTVCSFARLLVKRGDVGAAFELLERAANEEPFQKSYHYSLARLLMDSGGDAIRIERQLRSSFTEGDHNYEAQFFYARQLYVNGKIDDALSRFDGLARRSRDPRLKSHAVHPWVENNESKKFRGTVDRVEASYLLVKRDVEGDTLIAPKRANSRVDLARFGRGDRVTFEIAFNYRGPVATSVEMSRGV